MVREKRKKIAIVWANPYSKNLGVGALAYSSLAMINDVLKENNLQGDITFVGSFKEGIDSISIGGEVITYDNIVGLDYLHWKSWVKLLLKSKKFGLNRLIKFDYVYDIAEGDSFTDIYGESRFSKIYSSKKLFSLLKIKQVLLPQTIGPFNNPGKEKKAIEIMKEISLVISRDKKSYDYSASFMPENRIAETIDVAFYMPFVRREFGNGKINVGINVSGLLWNGGYTRKNQFNMKTDYKKLIRETLSYFSQIEGVQVHLVPHVIPENIPVEDDFAASEELKVEFPQVEIAPRFATPIEAKSYISGFDFFTGARMHACIAAFSAGVPVFPMAYSRKFNGLFEDTLHYKVMGDCVNDSEEVVLESLKKAFLRKEELEMQIKDVHNKIVSPRLQLLKNYISESLKD